MCRSRQRRIRWLAFRPSNCTTRRFHVLIWQRFVDHGAENRWKYVKRTNRPSGSRCAVPPSGSWRRPTFSPIFFLQRRDFPQIRQPCFAASRSAIAADNTVTTNMTVPQSRGFRGHTEQMFAATLRVTAERFDVQRFHVREASDILLRFCPLAQSLMHSAGCLPTLWGTGVGLRTA